MENDFFFRTPKMWEFVLSSAIDRPLLAFFQSSVSNVSSLPQCVTLVSTSCRSFIRRKGHIGSNVPPSPSSTLHNRGASNPKDLFRFPTRNWEPTSNLEQSAVVSYHLPHSSPSTPLPRRLLPLLHRFLLLLLLILLPQPQRRLHPLPEPLARRMRVATILLPMDVALPSSLPTVVSTHSQPTHGSATRGYGPRCGNPDDAPPGSCPPPERDPPRLGRRARRAGSARYCPRHLAGVGVSGSLR